MRKTLILILFLLFTISFAGCRYSEIEVTNKNNVSAETPMPTEFVEVPARVTETTGKENVVITLAPLQSLTNWQKNTQKKFSFYGDWTANDDLYMNVYDNQSCSLDYSIVPFDWPNEEYNLESIYAPGITEDLKKQLQKEFGENLEQVYLSPSMENLFIIVQDKVIDGSCIIDYSAWIYELDTHNTKELFWTGEELDYYCPLYSITESSVTWLQNDKKIYLKCGYEEFGNLLIDIDKSTIKSVTLNSGCHEQLIPNFSGNGKKVLVDNFGEGKIYWTDDYLNYLDQCLLGKNSFSDMEYLDRDVSEVIYSDFQTQNLAKIPDQGDHWLNIDGWGFNDEYYYYLELGNGRFDFDHNRRIDRINLITGEIEEIIPAEQLKQNGIALSNLRVSVSPNGNYLLIINHTTDGRVFVVQIDN